jgi:hypothetical protein
MIESLQPWTSLLRSPARISRYVGNRARFGARRGFNVALSGGCCRFRQIH